MVKLAASRLTSYSKGPGSVSSKSLTSNSSRRSGEAKAPKFDRWASPQVGIPTQLHLQPRGRGGGQVGGHDLGRAPVEGERRDQHAAVADRDQVGLAGGVLLLQQPHRVGPVAGRRPAVVAGQRRPLARLLAPGPPFLDARMRDLLHRHCGPHFIGWDVVVGCWLHSCVAGERRCLDDRSAAGERLPKPIRKRAPDQRAVMREANRHGERGYSQEE